MENEGRRIAEDLGRYSTLERLLVDDLREMLAEHPDETDTRWIQSVLDGLCETIDLELELETAAGYLAEVLERYPSWEPQVEQLKRQHRQLRDDLAALRKQFDTPPSDARLPAALRRKFHDWFERYSAHKHQEFRLLQEAMTLDVGEGE